MEEFSPGVEVIERSSIPAIQVAGTSVSAIIAQTKRGPDNKLTLISNMDQFTTRYGGYGGTTGYLAARAYFEQGGSGLYVGRVVGANAAKGYKFVYPTIPIYTTPINISSISLSSGSPVGITGASAHGLSTGQVVIFSGVGGTVELNNREYTITVTSTTAFTLDSTNGADFTTFTSGGSFLAPKPVGYFEGSSYGDWANSTFLTTSKYDLDFDMTNTVASTDTDYILDSVTGIEVGDVAILTQPADDADCPTNYYTRVFGIVTAINTSTKTVTLLGNAVSEYTVSAVDITTSSGSPVEITTSASHNFNTGQLVRISSVGGITPDINGVYTVDVVSGTKFTLRDTLQGDYSNSMTGTPKATAHIGTGANNTATFKSVSRHKAKTTLAEAYTGGSTLVVSNSSLITKGALLTILFSSGGSDYYYDVRVDEINSTTLSVTLVANNASGKTAPIDSTVVSQNFDVLHKVDGTTTRYENLNLETTSSTSYATTVLSNSEYLRYVAVTEPTVPGSYGRHLLYPLGFSSSPLTGGADGSAPVDNDYLGANTSKTYTHGMLLLDSVNSLPQFAIPGQGAVVQKGADAYAQNRGDTVYLGDVPLSADELDEIIEFRNVTLNVQSSFSALYAPYTTEVDPDNSSATVSVPLSARALGVLSSVSRRRGTHKPPANEFLVGSVVSLTTSFTDAEHAVLNAIGVNLARNTSAGLKIMGARTLWPIADDRQFLNVRRILNAIKKGLIEFGNSLAFEPNDEVLWKNIERAGNRYLTDRWKERWFYPSSDPTKAFFFVCDETTNTEAVRKAGKTKSKVGVRPTLPGELLTFDLYLWDGGASIDELGL